MRAKISGNQVDESWNVKVADFGFARIKEENATMTRCGTPCWTGRPPPERYYNNKLETYALLLFQLLFSSRGVKRGKVFGEGRRVQLWGGHVGGTYCFLLFME